MTTYTWQTIRLETVAMFHGQVPHADTEQNIIDVFALQPALVIKARDQVAAAFKAGTAASPWGLLLHRVQKLSEPARHVTATDSRDRDKALIRAEQWMRTAGTHYPSWDEAQDELFGDLGRLKQWPDLQTRMLELYEQVRGSGQQVDQDNTDRAEAFKQANRCRQCNRVSPPWHRICPYCKVSPPEAAAATDDLPL